MKYENSSPFGVAHYILLIAVTVLCIGVIVYAVWWGMPQKGRPVPSPVQVVTPGECAQNCERSGANVGLSSGNGAGKVSGYGDRVFGNAGGQYNSWAL